ncbi:MAG: sensor histidine kinase [Rhizomicrobium sp.]
MTSTTAAVITIVADKRAVTQILVNLLSTAVKFTKRRGTIPVFALRTPSGGITLGVEDTGMGMTAEVLKTALEPFGQVQHAVTVEGRGTGLGLPLVKSFVEAHGAVFGIESAPDHGTRVWGEFPAKAVVPTRAVA